MNNLLFYFVCSLIQLIFINLNLLYSEGNGSNNTMVSEMHTNCKLDNGLISLEVELDNGYYSITSNEIEFKKCNAFLLYNNGKKWLLRKKKLKKVEITDSSLVIASEGDISSLIKISLPRDASYLLIKFSIQNNTTEDITLEKLVPFSCYVQNLGSNLSFYKNNYYSWGLSGVIMPGEYDFPKSQRIPPVQNYTRYNTRSNRISDMMTVLTSIDNGKQATLGFTSHGEQLNHIRLYDMKRIIATCEMDHILLAPNEMVESEEFFIDCSPPEQALQHYARRVNKLMKPKFSDEIPFGWCSWYRYFDEISEEIILKDLEFFAKCKDEFPIDYFQIDDGYQLDNFTPGRAGLGDWLETNDKFPHGMKWLADKIKKAGFKPAIWIAPFILGTKSRIALEHPEVILKDNEGYPIPGNPNGWRGDPTYSLDCTHPVAQQWLRDVFRVITKEWGYEYVKVDFTYAGAYQGDFYNPRVTRAQAYRMGFKAIRESVGPDIFILGCGAPLGPSIGYVDGMRIGEDVSPDYWYHPQMDMGYPCMMAAIQNTIARYFMHKQFWLNDPDCIMVRQVETKLTSHEVITWATLVALSNGMLVISDKMDELSDFDKNLLKVLYPLYKDDAEPINLFTQKIPNKLVLDVVNSFEHYKVAGIFNLNDSTQNIMVQLADFGLARDKEFLLFEFWSQKYLGKKSGAVVLEDIPPHGCKLLVIKPVTGKNQLLGTDIHYTSGGVEIEYLDINENIADLKLTSKCFQQASLTFYHAQKDKAITLKIPTNKAVKLNLNSIDQK
jgi:alpha-galactosidase